MAPTADQTRSLSPRLSEATWVSQRGLPVASPPKPWLPAALPARLSSARQPDCFIPLSSMLQRLPITQKKMQSPYDGLCDLCTCGLCPHALLQSHPPHCSPHTASHINPILSLLPLFHCSFIAHSTATKPNGTYLFLTSPVCCSYQEVTFLRTRILFCHPVCLASK